MCAPFSQADQPSTSHDAADLAYVLSVHLQRSRALAQAVSGLVYQRKTLDDACGRDSLNDLCRAFEGSIEGLREGLCLALTGREPPRGNVPALAAAAREFMEEREIAAGLRPRDPLATAMRRVDTAEEAERFLIEQARDRGAEIARLDAAHPYGKSAEPKVVPVSHEAGFVSPAAA